MISEMDPSSSTSNLQQPNKRGFSSCRRCKTRKIRCQGGLSGCATCVKAGVPCMDITVVNQDIPRSMNVELAERIVHLESVIRTRCPDVDLSAGPGSAAMRSMAAEFEILAARHATSMPLQPGDNSIASGSNHSTHSLPISSDPDPSTHRSNLPKPPDHDSNAKRAASTTSDLSPGASRGLVSLFGAADHGYVGPATGFSFTQLLSAAVPSSLASEIGDDDGQEDRMDIPEANKVVALNINSLKYRLKEVTEVELVLPHPAQMIEIMSRFFTDIHCQFPCLLVSSFNSDLELVYQDDLCSKPVEELDPNSGLVLFRVLMVLAISLLLHSGRPSTVMNHNAVFTKANSLLGRVVNGPLTLGKTQCLVLLALYSLHSPDAPNPWTLSYHSMSACVELGLQRNLKSDFGLLPADVDLRKRLFWCSYSMDRLLCVVLGRPMGLSDGSFDVMMPANATDAEIQRPDFDAHKCDPAKSTPMSPSIRFFEIMRFFSSIKFHCYRLTGGPERQAADLEQYRRKTMLDLKNWRSLAGESTNRSSVRATFELRFHQAVLLLYRPSPAFPTCNAEALEICGTAARELIRVVDSQQRNGRLVKSFLHVHDMLLAGLTLLYCLRQSPSPKSTRNRYAPEFRAASSILATMSDTWLEARRARNLLDKLADAVVMHEDDWQPPAATSLPTPSSQEDLSFQQILQQLFHSSNSAGAPPAMWDDSNIYSMPEVGNNPASDFDFLQQPASTNGSENWAGPLSGNGSMAALLYTYVSGD